MAYARGALDEPCMAATLCTVEVDDQGPEGVRCTLLLRWKVDGERELGEGLECVEPYD